MPESWIDTIAVVIVIGGALAILYKGLKEPIDLLLGVIKRSFSTIKDKILGDGESGIYETINYG